MGRDHKNDSVGDSQLPRDVSCLQMPIHFFTKSPNLPHAASAQSVPTSFPLSYFSMETMKKLFLILLSFQTLFLVLAFATKTLA